MERLDPALCEQRLKAVLEIGNEVLLPSGEPFFAFRLHQFLASGGSVFATIEPPDRRELTTEGRFYVGRGDDLEGARVLFPLGFCRRCGQEHYLVSRTPWDDQERLLPRSPLLRYDDEDVPGEPGYFSIEHDEHWHEDEDLPDNWLEWRLMRLKSESKPDVPASAVHPPSDFRSGRWSFGRWPRWDHRGN